MVSGNHIGRNDEPQVGAVSRPSAMAGVIQAVTLGKVPFHIKAIAFAFSTLTLSWFFEGCREIGHDVSLGSVSVLLAGTLFTVALLVVQGYWTYMEEKRKGTLKKRIRMFENFYAQASACQSINGDSGEGL